MTAAHCVCPSCQRDRATGRLCIQDIAATLARERKSSILILEVTREGNAIVCSDHASLLEDDGQRAVLAALFESVRDIGASLLAMMRQLAAGEELQSTFERTRNKA